MSHFHWPNSVHYYDYELDAAVAVDGTIRTNSTSIELQSAAARG